MAESEFEKPLGGKEAPGFFLGAKQGLDPELERIEREVLSIREHDPEFFEQLRKARSWEFHQLLQELTEKLVASGRLKLDPAQTGSSTQSHGGTIKHPRFLILTEKYGLGIVAGLFLFSLAGLYLVAFQGWNPHLYPTYGIGIATVFSVLYAYSTRVRSK